MRRLIGLFFFLVVCTASLQAQQRFSELIGNVRVAPVQQAQSLKVPYITWGGDVATFHANGGLKTKPSSAFNKLGLNLQMTPGDDFPQQVRDYLAGKTPFLRGTYRMLAQANEVLGANPGTKPVVILQLSWSAGDHIVVRESIKTLNDLAGQGKKIRIACQQGGPHVGLLYDALEQAGLTKDAVDIRWVKDLTGDKGPAELFRKSDIDACCVITPDMIGLTGGQENVGSGAEGTVKGARVLVSTQQMSRSIADVYAVRSDWYRNNRATVEKFVVGYLQGTKAVVDMRKEFEKTQRLSANYRSTLKVAQDVFGKEVLPTLEVDAHGLLLDCGFVGLPGQVAFFDDKQNVKGFERMMESALEMAESWGYSQGKFGFAPAGLDYRRIAKLSGLEYDVAKSSAIVEGAKIEGGDKNTILSFNIGFAPDQNEFPAVQYAAEFKRAIKSAATFGNAVVMIRGHSDSWPTTVELLKAGMTKGSIKRTGTKPNYRYSVDGRVLNVGSPAQVISVIKTAKFDNVVAKNGNRLQPSMMLASAEGLAEKRANVVKSSLLKFAKDQKLNLDLTQIKVEGVGILEPAVPRPRNRADSQKNRRVEFRILRVAAEALQEKDYDF